MKEVKLGIVVPYYNNSEVAEELCKKLFLERLVPAFEKNKNIIPLMFEDFEGEGCGITRNKIMNYLIHICNVDYILFVDSDDYLDEDYLDEMYEACKMAREQHYNIIESKFSIRGNVIEYKKDVLPKHVCGICYDVDLIGDTRFDESVAFGEDEVFNKEIMKKPINKFYLNTTYIYNYGYNRECMSYRWSRGEIK